MKNKQVIIKATLGQLGNIGISRDIRNMKGVIVEEYNDGGYWYGVSVEPREDIKRVLGDKAENEVYDIPYFLFEEVK